LPLLGFPGSWRLLFWLAAIIVFLVVRGGIGPKSADVTARRPWIVLARLAGVGVEIGVARPAKPALLIGLALVLLDQDPASIAAKLFGTRFQAPSPKDPFAAPRCSFNHCRPPFLRFYRYQANATAWRDQLAFDDRCRYRLR
jgi:hypothetical protein